MPGVEAMDGVETHNCFTITEYTAIDHLGLTPPGQSWRAVEDRLRATGFDNQNIVKVLAHVALNLFTNYVNVAFAVSVDFPVVKLRRGA